MQNNLKVKFSFFLAASVPPDFSQKLNNVEANPGDHVQFSVKTIGVPKPQVKWYREVREKIYCRSESQILLLPYITLSLNLFSLK